MLVYGRYANEEGIQLRGKGSYSGASILGLNVNFVTHWLCDLWQVTQPFWASVCSSINMRIVTIRVLTT